MYRSDERGDRNWAVLRQDATVHSLPATSGEELDAVPLQKAKPAGLSFPATIAREQSHLQPPPEKSLPQLPPEESLPHPSPLEFLPQTPPKEFLPQTPPKEFLSTDTTERAPATDTAKRVSVTDTAKRVSVTAIARRVSATVTVPDRESTRKLSGFWIVIGNFINVGLVGLVELLFGLRKRQFAIHFRFRGHIVQIHPRFE
ncbi:hypothetical protein MTO96_017229 [Rhipicephalus appendiculatus]